MSSLNINISSSWTCKIHCICQNSTQQQTSHISSKFNLSINILICHNRSRSTNNLSSDINRSISHQITQTVMVNNFNYLAKLNIFNRLLSLIMIHKNQLLLIIIIQVISTYRTNNTAVFIQNRIRTISCLRNLIQTSINSLIMINSNHLISLNHYALNRRCLIN